MRLRRKQVVSLPFLLFLPFNSISQPRVKKNMSFGIYLSLTAILRAVKHDLHNLMCACVCLCVYLCCVCVCVFVWLSYVVTLRPLTSVGVYVCVWVWGCVCVCACIFKSCAYVRAYLGVRSIYVCVCVCLFMHVMSVVCACVVFDCVLVRVCGGNVKETKTKTPNVTLKCSCASPWPLT